jgi:hypothetical protein
MDVRELVRRALDEDGVGRDLTTLATVSEDARARGTFLAKDDLVISGLDVAAFVFEAVDARAKVSGLALEGARVTRGTFVGHVDGPARSLLQAERVALNFVQRLSGNHRQLFFGFRGQPVAGCYARRGQWKYVPSLSDARAGAGNRHLSAGYCDQWE